MQRPFFTFLGVDLGGARGKSTALVRLRLHDSDRPTLLVEDCGTGKLYFDEPLLSALRVHHHQAVLAMDVPLTLPACVRCVLPCCPGLSACQVPTVRWFAAQAGSEQANPKGKPRYTPYTQRVTDVLLRRHLHREALSASVGPLSARAQYLRHALSDCFTLYENLIEVCPKASLAAWFPDPPAAKQNLAVRYRDGQGQPVTISGQPLSEVSRVARAYKRSGHAHAIREQVLDALPELVFSAGQWRETVIANDHVFDALICAYTAYLWARDGQSLPTDPEVAPVFAEDGYIFVPSFRLRGPRP